MLYVIIYDFWQQEDDNLRHIEEKFLDIVVTTEFDQALSTFVRILTIPPAPREKSHDLIYLCRKLFISSWIVSIGIWILIFTICACFFKSISSNSSDYNYSWNLYKFYNTIASISIKNEIECCNWQSKQENSQIFFPSTVSISRLQLVPNCENAEIEYHFLRQLSNDMFVLKMNQNSYSLWTMFTPLIRANREYCTSLLCPFGMAVWHASHDLKRAKN